MVRIAPQPFLKSMASQGNSDKPQGHMSNFIPEIDIRGVQHDRLEAAQEEDAHAVSSLAERAPVATGGAQYQPGHSSYPGKLQIEVIWTNLPNSECFLDIFCHLNISISYTFDR